MQSLKEKVAIVAGATRGACRGIACILGEAGAAVYCCSRRVRDCPSEINRMETIKETAEMVNERGGTAFGRKLTILTQPQQVSALFVSLKREQGHLDILVNNMSGDQYLAPGMLSGKGLEP